MAVARGIRRTPTGWEVYGRVRGTTFSRRFPADTALAKLKEWREAEKVRVRTKQIVATPPPVDPTTFAADAVRYLTTCRAMPTYQEREKHIKEWVAVFGTRQRHEISSTEIRAQLQTWTLDGYAASSVNHRRSALMRFFSVLDADLPNRRQNPVEDTARVRPVDPQPLSLTYPVIAAILTHTHARGVTKGYARLLVLAWTGLPPSTLKRIERQHWDKDASRVYVPGRLKGKGTRPRTLTLTPEANAAFALMEKTGAFGSFDTSSLNRLWKRAAKKDGVIGPTLYALRHSAGTAFYAATGDIQATANLLGHADIRQTRRYALAAQDGRADAALAAFRKQVGARKLAAKLAVSEKPKK